MSLSKIVQSCWDIIMPSHQFCLSNNEHNILPLRRKLVRQEDGRLFTSTGVILYAPVQAGRSTKWYKIRE